MNPVSFFVKLYAWANYANLPDEIEKKVISQATYDILKILGSSFISKVKCFFRSEDEAKEYLDRIYSSSIQNKKDPYRISIELLEQLGVGQLDEIRQQQFIETLKRWVHENSNEIEKLLEKENSVNKLDILINKFVHIFYIHGISKIGIIKVVPDEFALKMRDFDNCETIKNIISPKLIEWTSTFFNIQIKWLEGTSDRMYLCKSFIGLQELFNVILNIIFVENNNITAFVFKSGRLNCKEDNRQPLALLLRAQISTIDGNCPIYRYIPIGREWNWGWENSRYELKYTLYFLRLLGIYLCGCTVSDNTIYNLISGSQFPGEIIENSQIGSWDPEDYIELVTENRDAKETHETQKYREAFYKEGYQKNIESEIDKIISDEGEKKYIKEAYLFRFNKENYIG